MKDLVIRATETQLKLKDIALKSVFKHEDKKKTKAKVKKAIYELAKDYKKDAEFFSLIVTGLAASFGDWYRYTEVQLNKSLAVISDKEPKDYERPWLFFNVPNRPFITDSRIALPLVEDYRHEIKKAYVKIASKLAQSEALIDSRVSLRNLSEMEIRHEAIEADINRLKQSGTKLVWCTTHANCSKRCEEWQGRLYSLDGSYGVIDGIKFIPLEVAVNIPQTTRSGKVYTNGLLGFNCRHRLVPYVQGSTAPKEYTEAQIAKERRIDQKQRRMEQGIRRIKSAAFLIKPVDFKKAMQLFAKAREYTAVYRQYSEENGRAAIIDRTRVLVEEIEFNSQLAVQ